VNASIRIRSWVRGSADDERRGLLGYLSIYFGPLVLDGITVRRTTTGRLVLSFPARADRQGRRHAYIAPVDDEARQRLEGRILKALVGIPPEVAP
jgi:hypothetical protein